MIDRPPDGRPECLTIGELTDRARALLGSSRRTLLGITGPPGAGKSTLAEAIQTHFGASAALVPMDGFHLPKAELAELGRLDHMGAPDTFDAEGFVALVREIRDQRGRVILAPAFDRDRESTVADAIRVSPADQLVIVEGNYLLLDYGPWSELRDLLDEVWYVDVDRAVRLDRLISRHVAFGKAPEAARAWSEGPDEGNATVVDSARGRADLIVTLPSG